MQWPSRAEYAEAVRDYPRVSLQYLKLRGGRSKRGRDGSLISDAGAFSIVFPIDVVSKTFALRCWTQDVRNAEVRYKQISDYLESISLPYFVDFEYVLEGILVNGNKYPITWMEWAKGVSLRQFIGKNLQSPRIFKVVADEFQKMVDALHKHRIAHGDLQDGNILIEQSGTDVKLKLIDYDSLFVPALQGQPEQIVGLPEYQHPRRIVGGGQANKKVDYFSELVIYLSFLSLSENPALWTQFGDENRVDRGLLFSRKDFENPNQSDIFQELANLSLDVQQLTATLRDFCARTSVDELEPLEEILPKPDASTHTNRGDSFLNNGQYNEALAEYQKAIALDPQYKKARHGVGCVYLHTERYADAINMFEQLINIYPNYKKAYHGLGIAYFKSGDNSRAEAAANAALRIDPDYQHARELLDIIISAASPPVPPPSPKPKPPPSDPTPKPIINIWQYITSVLRNNRRSVIVGTLSLTLAVCFIVFLTQIFTKNELISQITELKKQNGQNELTISRNELEIQDLSLSVQNLESANRELKRDNSELQSELENRIFSTKTTSRDVINLRRQLSEQKDEKQGLQSQLIKKNTEIRQLRNDNAVVLNENQELKKKIVGSSQGTANQAATIQRLRKEKTDALTESGKLQKQLEKRTSETKNLTGRIQQLQNEKVETQRRNKKLLSENTDLVRQNRDLRNENATLRNQQYKAKQGNAKGVVGPEPPKKIQIQNYRSILRRAGSHNNQGCLDFERNDYDEAVKQFGQAIKADSKFAVAHYNLGCAYLEMKEYSGAIDAFDKTIDLDKKFKEAYYNRSLAYFRMSQFQEAKQDATKALDVDPNYRLAQKLLTAVANVQQ